MMRQFLGIFKVLLITFAMAIVVSLAGCQSTEAYTTAKELNDNTFALGMTRVCGPTAGLAASRQLSPLAQQYRRVLCSEWTKSQGSN